MTLYWGLTALLNVVVPILYYYYGYVKSNNLRRLSTSFDYDMISLLVAPKYGFDGYKIYPWLTFLIVSLALWSPILVLWPFAEFTNWELTAWLYVTWANISVAGPYGLYLLPIGLFMWQFLAEENDKFLQYILWFLGVLALCLFDVGVFWQFIEPLNDWYAGTRDTYRFDDFDPSEEAA